MAAAPEAGGADDTGPPNPMTTTTAPTIAHKPLPRPQRRVACMRMYFGTVSISRAHSSKEKAKLLAATATDRVTMAQ
jgi:hypothetical protein